MNVFDAITTRRSIRSYLPTPIEEEKLQKLLEAGRLAPGARVEQDFMIVLVTDPELRKELVPACKGQDFVAEAPVVMVMCSTNDRDMICGQPVRPIDCSIAMSFMMLEAEELGLGMCWLGWFSAEEVQRILEIPKEYKVFAVVPVGYPAEPGHKTSRKPMEQLVRYNKWEKK